MRPESEALGAAMEALHANDATGLRGVLFRYPSLSEMINEPVGPFDSPAIIHAKSREMLDVLLEAGADINARSQWWAGGFGLLDIASPEVAAYAIERGATITVHAAARLGLIDQLRDFLANDPMLVHARGGDGQTPLHMAATVDVAEALVAAGAELDARDVDHESTPAQYMVGDRHDVARHLVTRGCRTDLLMTAALGDMERARTHLDDDPDCIRMRVDEYWFPMANPKAGGSIYNWTLGFYASAHAVAKKFGQTAMLQMLFDRTPAALKVVEACWLEDETAARAFRAGVPSVAEALSDRERQMVAHAARNNQTTAVRLMLECGLPLDASGQHQASPLHWASFHGNADMIREILRFDPPLEATDPEFNGTPLGWAIHGSEHGWYSQTGDYPLAVELLLRAGAKPPSTVGGSPEVRQALQRTDS